MIAAVIVAAGCRHTPRIDNPIFRWESVGPTADSLLCVLDSTFIQADYTRFAQALGELPQADSILETAPATYYYWRMRDATRRAQYDSTAYWLKLALEHSDGSRRPYERNRIRMFQAMMAADKLHAYQHFDSALTGFKTAADSFMAADCYTHLSNIFYEIDDPQTSMGYLQQAIAIYCSLGIEPYAYKNKLNLASRLFVQGDTANARKTITRLVNDPYTRSDTKFYAIVMETGYDMLNQDSLLLRYYQLANMGEDSYESKRDANYLMSRRALKHHRLDSALMYSTRAVESQNRCANTEQAAQIWAWHARLLDSLGRHAPAWHYLTRASALKDSIHAAGTHHKIASMHAKSEIERMLLNKEWSARRSRLLFLLVTAMLALASSIVIGLLYRRNTRLKLASAQSSLDLERNRKILGQAILSIDEKNKVIDRLAEMAGDTVIDNNSLRRLRRDEKRRDNDLDHLQMLYDSVSSRLIVRLKEKTPAISPAMQQLAVLIVCGLDTKEIAAIMNIVPESVKKARYRMRKLLAVGHDENLTEVLKCMAAD